MNSELFINVNLSLNKSIPAFFRVVVDFLRITDIDLILVIYEDLGLDILHLTVVEAASRPVVSLCIRFHDLGGPVQVILLGESKREAIEAFLQYIRSPKHLKVLKPFFYELRSTGKAQLLIPSHNVPNISSSNRPQRRLPTILNHQVPLIIQRADDLLRKRKNSDLLLIDGYLLEDFLEVADFIGRDAEVESDVAVEQFGQCDEPMDDQLDYAALGRDVQRDKVFVFYVAVVGQVFREVE